jgi:hypothetical protein
VGPRFGLDEVEKILDITEIQTPTPRSSSPVAIPTALSRLFIEESIEDFGGRARRKEITRKT